MQQEKSEADSSVLLFFDLPDVVLRKIFKEYIPLSTKVSPLHSMPEFSRYLEDPCYWYPPRFRFFQLLVTLKPGWYLLPSDDVYYVSANETTLSYHIHHVNCLPCSTNTNSFKDIPTNMGSLKRLLQTFQKQSLYLGEDEIFIYCYLPMEFGIFLIDHQQKTVRWGAHLTKVYRFENDVCSLPVSPGNLFKLTLYPDKNVLMTYRILGVTHHFNERSASSLEVPPYGRVCDCGPPFKLYFSYLFGPKPYQVEDTDHELLKPREINCPAVTLSVRDSPNVTTRFKIYRNSVKHELLNRMMELLD